MNDQISTAIRRSRGLIDQNQLIARGNSRSDQRLDTQQPDAADNQNISLGDVVYALVDRVAVESLLVQHDIRLDNAAAGASRNAGVLWRYPQPDMACGSACT